MLLVEVEDVGLERLEEVMALIAECLDRPWPRDVVLSDLLEKDEVLYVGAAWRGSLVGLAVLELACLTGRLLFVGVRADYRRRYIGSQLVLSCAEVAKSRGCASLTCRSKDEEGLRSFYRSLGFRLVGREDGELMWALDLSAP